MHTGSRWKACCRLWNRWTFTHHSWRHWKKTQNTHTHTHKKNTHKKKKHAKLFKLAWHLLDVMTWGTAGTNSWASGMSVLTLPSPWATLAKSVHNLKCLRKAKNTKSNVYSCTCTVDTEFDVVTSNQTSALWSPPQKRKKCFHVLKTDWPKWLFLDNVMHFWFFEEMLWFTTWWLTSELYRSVQSFPTALSAGDQLNQQLAASRA